MNKNEFKNVKMSKGEMNVYDFGGIKLHAYKTNDLINDEVFIVEKAGRAVVIEAPCFKDNIAELTEYIANNSINVEGRLIAYHMAGNAFLSDVPVYTTQNAAEFGATGGGSALIKNFEQSFGEAFDGSVPKEFNFIDEGDCTIAGIGFIITLTQDAFDMEIPEINTVYTHMLGHDAHSIVAGDGHAQAIISQLNGYLARGYDLILSSHYTPEDLKDARTKLEYIEDLRKTANQSKDAQAFKAAVKAKYPDYAGDNYLDMTTGFFFQA